MSIIISWLATTEIKWFYSLLNDNTPPGQDIVYVIMLAAVILLLYNVSSENRDLKINTCFNIAKV